MAFALALAIGAAIGLLGGGGSLLTVPVFTYLLGYEPRQAVAMSLPVVCLATSAGAVRAWRAGTLRPGPALVTGVAAMAGAGAGARLAHQLPGRAQLPVLALTMLAAAALVRRARPDDGRETDSHPPHPAPLAVSGFGVGIL